MGDKQFVVKMILDSGDHFFTFRGLSCTNHFREPRLLSLGEIVREISPVPLEFRVSNFSFELDNSDGEIGRLKDAEGFKKRQVEILYGDITKDPDTLAQVACAKIENFAFGDIFRIDTEDTTRLEFDKELQPVIDDSIFPNVPDATEREIVPQVLGRFETGLGSIPCYEIDPNTPGNARYVVSTFYTDIINVFDQQVLVSAVEYTSSVVSFAGDDYTVLDFVTYTPNGKITADGDGLEVSASPITSISNPAEIWKTVLLRNGFTLSDLDTDSFDVAETYYNTQSITGAFSAIDRKETLRTISEEMAKSFNLWTIIGKDGLIKVVTPDLNPIAADVAKIREYEVAADLLPFVGVDDAASSIRGSYFLDFASGQFILKRTRSDSDQVTAFGQDIRQFMDMKYVRANAVFDAVVDDKLFFMQENRVVANLNVDADFIDKVDIGSTVLLSHHGGLGQDGYDEARFRVIGTGLSFQEAQATLRLTLVSLD